MTAAAAACRQRVHPGRPRPACLPPLLLQLSVRSLSRSVGGRSILQDLSFSLSSGETLFVTGPSGVGKSLLLRALACLGASSCGCCWEWPALWAGARLACQTGTEPTAAGVASQSPPHQQPTLQPPRTLQTPLTPAPSRSRAALPRSGASPAGAASWRTCTRAGCSTGARPRSCTLLCSSSRRRCAAWPFMLWEGKVPCRPCRQCSAACHESSCHVRALTPATMSPCVSSAAARGETCRP